MITACSGEKNATEYLADANSYLESGDQRAALIETRNAVSQAPEDRTARLLLGRLELEQGNPAAAEGALLKAIALGADHAEVAESLTRSYFLQQKFEEVQNIDAESLPDPTKATVLAYQAEVAVSNANLTQAHELASAALAADPVSAVALTISARLQVLESNIPAARTYIAKALDESPTYSAAWELLGDIESNERRYPEAIDAYSQAIQGSGNGISPLFKRARTHLAMQDIASTRTDIEMFAKANIKSPSVGLLKAEVFLQESRFSDAQVALEESLTNAPDYLPAVRTLAITHILRNNLIQAEQYAKQYFDASNSDDSRVLLATIRLQANRLPQAEETLAPLADSGRLSILAAQLLATIQLKRNNIDDAVNTMLVLSANLTQSGISDPTHLALLTEPSSLLSSELTNNETPTDNEADAQNYLSDQETKVVEAVSAMVAEDFQSALGYASTLVQKQADHPDVHTLLARILVKTGDTVAAREALDRAIGLSSTPGTPIILKAMLLLSADESAKATDTLEDALRHAHGLARERILITLASIDARSGREEQAVTRLQQAHNENPESYQPALALANYHAGKSEPEKVLESLSELPSTSKQNAGVIELQIQAHISLGEFTEAIALATPMVQSMPNTARWRFLRAKAYAGQNNSEAVSRDIDIALRIDPDYAPARLVKANMSVLANDFQEAEMQLGQLESLIPGSEALTQLSGRMKAARENNAQSEASRSFDTPPASTEEVIERARIHWSAGDQQKAVATLKNWLDSNSEDVVVALTLANTYSALNQTKDAVDAFEEVLRVDQKNFVALNNLAWQLRKDNPEAAIAYASQAVELQPESPETLDTLAVIQLEQGMLTEAGETFESIKKLNPSDPTILYHGARIQVALGNIEDAKNILEPLISGGLDFPDKAAAKALYEEL